MGAGLWLSPFLLVIVAACAPVRRVAPVEVGQHILSAGFGGPIAEVGRGTGIYMPAPVITAGYGYGLHELFDLEAGLQVTELFVGGLALDAGVNFRPLRPEGFRPGLIFPVKVHGLVPFRGRGVDTMRLYPDIGVTALWQWPDRHFYTYVGVTVWFDLASRGDGNDQPSRVLPVMHLGQTLGNEIWQFSVELRYYTPNISDEFRLVDVADLGGQGSLGAVLGFSWALGGANQ
ncbi:MAG: hypothetical protein JRH11_06085 [Deltaproteobacteria bacterium]|nr:hypothetical protein [Deltaproteobacteria bacterium]